MSIKHTAGGINAADVDAKLPRTFFVMRGHIATAFGLTKHEMKALVENGTFKAEQPLGRGTCARFVRSKVLAIAKQWEST